MTVSLQVSQPKQSSGLDCPSATDSRSKTILVVDDSESLRAVVRSILVSQTTLKICGEAVDGLDAIDKARKLRPDLIILDVAMPRMNGLQAVPIIRRMMPHVRIVLFSMYGDILGPSPNSTLGVDAVIAKPEGINRLVPCVQTLLESIPRDEKPGPHAEPKFESDLGSTCGALGCPNFATNRAEWSNVAKLVCGYHKNLVDKKHWEEVAHLFGRTPFSN